MLGSDKTLTMAGRTVEPYLHLDNRGLVVSDGRRGVMFAGNTLGWVRETIELLLDEKRATRRSGDHFLGGMVSDDGRAVTIYAGPVDDLVTLEVDVEALEGMRDGLSRK